MTADGQPVTMSAMNVVNSQAVSPHLFGAARPAAVVAAPMFGGGFHNIGEILVLLLLLGGLGFAVTRRRNGRSAPPRDDQWIRPESRPDPPELPDAPGGTAVAPARSPRSDASLEHPADGWAVETRSLTKRFGANAAVDEVDLRVPRGSAFGYLGPNGAGKTTLIRTLLGLTRANGGTMSLLGIPVPRGRREALARVGAIVDEPRFHAHLTGRENLRLLAAARGGDASARIGPSLERVGLAVRADGKVARYSMGMRQRLGVASCLLGDPELLILDEPMNGLDPAGMHEMRTMIESLAAEGRTVVLSSHLLDEVERSCDAVAIVDHGRVIRQGPIDELIRGAGAMVVQVACAEPARAVQVIEQAGLAAGTARTEDGLTVTLPAGASRELIAEMNRRLVRAEIDVYGLTEARASLEEWFLSVTSRLGDPS
jgi:ABC-2 type transport system ATP-binding protein